MSYDDGYTAFFNGGRNPYPPESYDWNQWEIGYIEAQLADQRRDRDEHYEGLNWNRNKSLGWH